MLKLFLIHNQTFVSSSVGKTNGKMQRVDKFSKADTAFDFVLFIRISSSAAYRKFAFRLIPKMVTNRVWPGGQRGMYSLSMSERGTHTFKVEPYLTRSLKRKKTTHLFNRLMLFSLPTLVTDYCHYMDQALVCRTVCQKLTIDIVFEKIRS